MRAALLRGYGDPLEVEEVEIDSPREREVLIRTAAASVCHSDATVIDLYKVFPLPMAMGHESAGVVEEVGSAVDYVQPGDHVVTCVSVFCGACEFCLGGRPALCLREGIKRATGSPPRLTSHGEPVHQMQELASFAERLLVHEHAVVKIDPRMPLDKASLLGCGVLTGLGAVFNTAEVPVGSTVVVIGCGGVGLSAVEGARIAGALRIVAVDPDPSKRSTAITLGATDVVDPGEGDVVEQVRAALDGGASHVFEAVGKKETVESALPMLKPGGVLTIIGLIRHLSVTFSGNDLALERRVQSSTMGSNRFRIDIPRYVDLYLQGRLSLDELLSDLIRLDQVNDALDALREGEGLRQVIEF